MLSTVAHSLLLLFLLGDPVANSQQPKAPIMTLQLEEELRISDTDSDHLFWPGIAVNVTANSKGHMFVVNPKENNIVELNPKGEYVRTLGGTGQGPGEFQLLKDFQILDGDRAVAIDVVGAASSFSYFAADGTLETVQKNNDLSRIYVDVKFAPNGKYFFALYVAINSDGTQMTYKTGVFNAETNDMVFQLSERTEEAFNPAKIQDPNYWVGFLAREFGALNSGYGVADIDANSNLYTAVSTQYEVTRWNANLEKDLVVTREYDRISLTEDTIQGMIEPLRERVLEALPPQVQNIVTENVIKRAVETAEFPKYKQPIFGLLTLEDKGFLVLHDHRINERSTMADLYSPEGQFLGTVTKGGNAMINRNNTLQTRMMFRNGKAYAIETNAAGDNELVRFNYKIVKASK